MDGGGHSVEDLDRALLELLEGCSEPASETAQEEAALRQERGPRRREIFFESRD